MGPGETTSDWDSLFGAAQLDAAGALDAIEDTANMPLQSEPRAVQDELAQLQAR